MHDAGAARQGPDGPTARDWPAHPPACRVRVELSDFLGDAEVRAELAADPTHRLLELDPRVGVGEAGRVSIDLVVPGDDVWVCVLTVMALLRQIGYAVHALHVEGAAGDELERRPAAA